MKYQSRLNNLVLLRIMSLNQNLSILINHNNNNKNNNNNNNNNNNDKKCEVPNYCTALHCITRLSEIKEISR